MFDHSSGTESEQNELIASYRRAYEQALSRHGDTVAGLVRDGREARALEFHFEIVVELNAIHDGLSMLYETFFLSGSAVLGTYKSSRLSELHKRRKKRISLRREVASTDPTMDEFSIGYDVNRKLGKIGYQRTHPVLEDVLLREIEYMLDILDMLIEPGWIPGSEVVDEVDDSREDRPDRYISSGVKVSVWRRDRGQCVECRSQERLEYDHIIPVGKGGSNTERNIQLLCEKCNRQKGAEIV